MNQDYGSGLSVDELIGLTAWHIQHLTLPPGDAFESASHAADILLANNFDSYMLAELWADGHSVWHTSDQEHVPLQVTRDGKIIRSRH